jgi:hypothetical protein
LPVSQWQAIVIARVSARNVVMGWRQASSRADNGGHALSQQPSTGILYVVWGKVMGEELARARASAERTGYPVHIARLDEGPTFALARKARMDELSPFDLTLFLDSDTVVVDSDLFFGFEKARLHGLALTLSPACYARRHGVLKGDEVEYQTGAIFFSKAPKVREVFKLWRELAPRHRNDQASLAEAVAALNFNPFVLPKNWNYRADPDLVDLFGPMKIWHSRAAVPRCALEQDLTHYKVAARWYLPFFRVFQHTRRRYWKRRSARAARRLVRRALDWRIGRAVSTIAARIHPRIDSMITREKIRSLQEQELLGIGRDVPALRRSR